MLVGILERFVDHGIQLTCAQFNEFVCLFVSTMKEQRRKKLPFTNNTPGKFFCRIFYTFQKDKLKLGEAKGQLGKSWTSMNADTLNTHFARVEAVVHCFSVESSIIWNIVESETAPGIDASD